jgi:hypothetical protein
MGCPTVQWPCSSPTPRTHPRYAYHAHGDAVLLPYRAALAIWGPMSALFRRSPDLHYGFRASLGRAERSPSLPTPRPTHTNSRT